MSKSTYFIQENTNRSSYKVKLWCRYTKTRGVLAIQTSTTDNHQIVQEIKTYYIPIAAN
ncbi:MAG: hypothetical protein ACPGLV_00340 [Bacteroidia bacterium]